MNPSSAKDHDTLYAKQLAAELIMLLSAGNDTTSDAMIVGIYQILRCPKIYKKLNDELATLPPDLEQEIDYSKTKNLVYLVRRFRKLCGINILTFVETAVIKETLRYSSPLPGPAPRIVPSEGYILYGHTLAPGVCFRLQTPEVIHLKH